MVVVELVVREVVVELIIVNRVMLAQEVVVKVLQAVTLVD
jgi:hypothetical protein